MLKMRLALETAKEIANWVGNAVGDIAYDQYKMWEEYGDFNPALKKLKEDGVTDIAGAYADILYNDPDTLGDLMGDRVCDAVGWEDTEARAKFIDELCAIHSFPAWQKACNKLRR
jgi:hypothetical protein